MISRVEPSPNPSEGFEKWSIAKADQLEREASLLRRTLQEFTNRRDPYAWVDPFEGERP